MAVKGSFGLKIEGFKEIYRKMGLIEAELLKGAQKGLKTTSESILGESQKLVPVDTGTLQKSGTVQYNEDKTIATISYNTPYALKQHEDNTLNHDKSKNPDAQAKYLERPFNEKKGELESNIGNEFERILRKKSIS